MPLPLFPIHCRAIRQVVQRLQPQTGKTCPTLSGKIWHTTSGSGHVLSGCPAARTLLPSVPCPPKLQPRKTSSPHRPICHFRHPGHESITRCGLKKTCSAPCAPVPEIRHSPVVYRCRDSSASTTVFTPSRRIVLQAEALTQGFCSPYNPLHHEYRHICSPPCPRTGTSR